MTAREQLSIAQEERVVLFVGTGWQRKGLGFAIRAVEKLNSTRQPSGGSRKITLLVAGRGSVSRYNSPFVRFLGPVKQMAPVYAAADIFVTPTIFEPFSLAALEALSSGLPVITSSAAGISEIMTQDVHGEIIEEPSDIDSLAAALIKWLLITDDPARIAISRTACSELAAVFTLDQNLHQTLALINEVILEKESLKGA
jgi:UDP-glucose:(heptosyl)LPS alpha-1,3-glucosyltransferase